MSVILGRLFEGFWINCQLFGLTLLFALPLGLLISFGSMSRFQPLAWLIKTFVWIIRGTPLMLQLIIIFRPRASGLGQPVARRQLGAAHRRCGGFRHQLRLLFL